MKYLLIGMTAGLASIAIYYNGNLYVEPLIIAVACVICYGIGLYYGAEL